MASWFEYEEIHAKRVEIRSLIDQQNILYHDHIERKHRRATDTAVATTASVEVASASVEVADDDVDLPVEPSVEVDVQMGSSELGLDEAGVTATMRSDDMDEDIPSVAVAAEPEDSIEDA